MTKGLTEKIDRFFDHYRSVTYKAGEIIIRPNGQITNIYYIKSGNIRQYINSPDGERLTLQLFKPHAFIPLVLFLNEAHNNYTYQAVVPTEVKIAPVKDVVAFLKENPEVLFDLTTRLSQAIAGLLKKFELIAFDTAYTRILSLIIHLGIKFGKERGEECKIAIPLSHYDIASLLGMRRETISRQFAQLQKRGIVRYEDEHIVLINLLEAKRELKRSKNSD